MPKHSQNNSQKNFSDIQRKESVKQAIEKFSEYLKLKGYRYTEERISVLKEIYLSEGHFNADEIFIRLKAKNISISRATVYNTLDLLVKSKLVLQNSFGHKHQHYESMDKNSHHDHIICKSCGEVHEFLDNTIEKMKKQVCEKLGFRIDTHSLQIFAECTNPGCNKKVAK